VVTVVVAASSDDLEALAARCPVWVIDTPANRTVAERLWARKRCGQAAYDLTTFKSAATSPEEAVVGVLDTVDLHHGEYSGLYNTVEVIGATASTAVRTKLADLGLVVTAERPTGFTAERAP
jgi:hypothetical protein